jgi:hypothetical protein
MGDGVMAEFASTQAALAAAFALLERGQAAYLEAMTRLALEKGAPLSWIASVCAQLGRYDEAFEWLERAVAAHDFLLVGLAVSPMYDPLRDDARYRALLERQRETPRLQKRSAHPRTRHDGARPSHPAVAR